MYFGYIQVYTWYINIPSIAQDIWTWSQIVYGPEGCWEKQQNVEE